MSFWELSQPLVSRLCEHFSLPCNPPAAVDDARDKQVPPSGPCYSQTAVPECSVLQAIASCRRSAV